MRGVPRVLVALTLAVIARTFFASSAFAFEPGEVVPFLPGSTGGVPIGVLPPPAFYASSLLTWAGGTFHADSRPAHPDHLSVFGQGLLLLWVPDITLLWGARYGAFAEQTVVEQTVSGLPPRHITKSQSGLANTVISPLNLSWALPANVFVSTRFAFYPPDGQYTRNDIVNTADNFWTFEPSLGISYLMGGFDFSLHLVYDIIGENRSTNVPGSVGGRYQSGNVFTAEYTASQAFGHWRFGVTGWGVQQTRDDSAGGRTLHGTELSTVGIGPLVEYNIRWLGVNLYYVRDVSWHGTFGGNHVFLRGTVKF